ncbi:MAG: hypothetical protein J6Y26_00860 [Lachnospiraceae bacterium]|nr:hypothetical protein [Lachnospiraceae bacterium]
MKKTIIPILIILLIGGTVAGVLLLNRKHKEDVKKYKETVKDLMSLLYNDADDLEQGVRDTLAEWKKAAEEAGSSDVSKGFLEDVLSREEQKEIRNQLLTQFKSHRNDRLNLKEKIEDFPKSEKALKDDVLAYWELFSTMGDTYSNFATVDASYDRCCELLETESAQMKELYDRIMKQVTE